MKPSIVIALVAAMMVALGLETRSGAYGFERSGVCEVIRNNVTVQRKTCLSDHYNSGLITITTNNGTLSFQLHDSRLGEHNLNGSIYVLRGDGTRDFCMWSRSDSADGYCFRQL